MNITQIKTELLETGYSIIDNFLPLELANSIHNLYEQSTEWDATNQIRENHLIECHIQNILHNT
jgi:hypothetical protein